METLTWPRTARLPHDSAASLDAADYGTHEQIESAWLVLLRRHLFQGNRLHRPDRPPRVRFDNPAGFDGRVRSGTLGGLSYCHLDAASHVFIDDRPPPGPLRHMVVLQLSGTSTFTGDSRPVRVRPGDMLLLNNVGPVRVEHETRVEQIALLNPLDTGEASCFKRHGLHCCPGQGQLERMVFRWVREACLDTDFDQCNVSHDVARLLTGLLGQVLVGAGGHAATEASPALTRERIEDYIAQRLQDVELSPARIAAAFGCSVRTLHRAFARAGRESLERHLWQMRVGACAQALRDDAAASTTLTQLALRYGFKSPTHFSALFRDLQGVSPSAYRRRYLGR